MVFNETKRNYITSKHAVESYIQRTKQRFSSFEEEKNSLIKTLESSEIVIETDKFRYLKSGPYYFPCAKYVDEGILTFKAITTLTHKMIEDQFDETIERYANT